MRKVLLAVFVSAVLIAPNFSPVNAVTKDELQRQISALLAQIKQLQDQLAEIQNQPKEWCYDFKKNLKIEDEGNGVDALEQVLQKEGLSAREHSSNFQAVFDEDMASAVSGFQEKYADDTLKPLGLKHGTGYVGKGTRSKLNELYGCKNRKIPSVSSEKGIVVNFPKNGGLISSPLAIKGYVNGNGWYGFEVVIGV